MQVSTALACARVIAEGIAMLPWKVMRETERERKPDRSHWLYDKLSVSPNPIQTAFEFTETMGLHLALCGSAYVWLMYSRGQVDAMYLIDPKWVTITYKWPEQPTYVIRTEDGRTINLSASDMWHIRGPSWQMYKGLEFLEIAREALGLAIAIEEGQSRLHANGVVMPGYISMEGTLTKEQHAALRGWLEKEHEGATNAGRAMILDHSAKWLNTSMTNSDAQTLEQRYMQVEEVCRFMRVLPIMVGHADKTATYASSEQMFLAHSMYTSGPWARRLEQSADLRMLTPEERAAGYYTNLNEKAMLRMTALDQIDYLSRGVLSGIFVRNEAREVLDLNPINGLDEPLSPSNMFVGLPPRASASGNEKPKPSESRE
jgi:HK97 family phage portal protein